MKKFSTGEFLMAHAPNFAWCAWRDLFNMAEIYFDDVLDEVSFQCAIMRLVKKGHLKCKTDKSFYTRKYRTSYLYLRVTK